MLEDRDSQLDQIAAEITAQYRAGIVPNVVDFCDRYPDLAADIRELFPALVRLEQARPDEQRPAASLEREADAALVAPGAPPLGDYRIVREIGRGGMGIVYEALQESLNRRVALKVLSSRTVQNPRHVERFEREARAAAQLHHTNIVSLLGVGEDRGVRYLVMQLIEGHALDEVLLALRSQRSSIRTSHDAATRSNNNAFAHEEDFDRTVHVIAGGLRTGRFVKEMGMRSGDSPRSTASTDASRRETAGMVRRSRSGERDDCDLGPAYWRSIARLGLQVAEALEYASNQGVLHRDIKPSNLLLDAHGMVWIADFGLAKTADSVELTMSGELLGTLRYMPPERLRGQSDVRGDVYSLGATLYEAATLEPPFDEDEQAVLLRRIVDTAPPPPRAHCPAIPRDLETIILKAMSKEPRDRYATAASMAHDLHRFLEDVPISARRISVVERSWRWCRRHPAIALPTAATTLLLVVVALGSFFAAARLRQENQAAREAERRAVDAERDRRLELFRAHVTNARGAAATGRVGQRLTGLQAIREALAVMETSEPAREQRFELIDAAIPCLAQADVRELNRSPVVRGGFDEIDIDPSFQWYTQPAEQGSGTVVVSLTDAAVRRDYRGDPTEISAFHGVRRFSPKGRWLFEYAFRSRHDDSKRTRVWERATGRLALDLTSREQGQQIDFHPDERHLLILGADSVFRLFDLETGQVVRESPPRFRGTTPRFDPNGKTLAVITTGDVVEIVDPQTWKTLDFLTGAGTATTLAFGPDNSLAVGAGDGRLYQWHFTQRYGHFLAGGHKNSIERLRFSPDGAFLASFGDGVTQIRRVDGDQLLLEIPGSGVRFSPDEKRLAVHDHNQLVIYELVTSAAFRTLHNSYAEAAVFSPDARWLAVSGTRGVGLWSTDRWTQDADLGLDQCGPVAFEPDGSALVTFGFFTQVCRWPIQSGDQIRFGPPRSVSYDQMPDFAQDPLSPQHQGRQVVFDAGGRMTIADYRRGRVLIADGVDDRPREFARLLNVARLTATPDGKWIAGAAVYSMVVRVWNAADASVALDLPYHSAVAFSSDGQWLASRSDSEVHLYRVGTWDRAHRIELEGSRGRFILPMAFQPQGPLLAVAGPQQRVYLYDRDSGRLVVHLPHVDEGELSHLAFSPDGSRLVAVTRFSDLAVWDLNQLQSELAELKLPADDFRLVSTTQAPVEGSRPANIVIDRGELPAGQWYRCWQRLAANEAEEGNWADAIHAMNMAIDWADNPSASIKAELLVKRGEYHLGNREPGGARADWEAAVALLPAATEAAENLVRLHLFGPAEVRDPYRAAPLIALLEQHGEPRSEGDVLRALTNIRLRNFSAEETARLEASIEHSRWQDAGSYLLALAYHSLGDQKRATEALTKARVSFQSRDRTLTDTKREELESLQAEVESALTTKLN